MDSLADMLKNRAPAEPPEIERLKIYMRKHYDFDVSVRIGRDCFILTAPGAAFASRLRLDSIKISKCCEIEKRLVILMGHPA